MTKSRKTGHSAAPPFEDVAESAGLPLTREGADMMYTRYVMAAEASDGKRVLELGCGGGPGFGLLARKASSLVGADYSASLLQGAREHYGNRVPLVRLSAESLPFRDGSFDVVLVFEATYYVPNMEAAFDEIGRVLGPQGSVIFVNANPERPDFIHSPYTHHYHTADEFRAALEKRGFATTSHGAFPTDPTREAKSNGGLVSRLVPIARKMLERLHVVPRTLRGRARLKRLLYRNMVRVPAELPVGFATVQPLSPLERGGAAAWKVIYVRGTKR